MRKKKKPLPCVRFEIYHPYSGRNSLKPVLGFTEGKKYEILSESSADSGWGCGHYMGGINYFVIDDLGRRRQVNSNYFKGPEPILCKMDAEKCGEIDLDSLEMPDLRTLREKRDENVVCYSGVPEYYEYSEDVTTLEEKINKRSRYTELNSLAGTRRKYNPLDAMKKHIGNLRSYAKFMLSECEKMEAELENIKKIS